MIKLMTHFFFQFLEFQTRCPYGKKTKLYKKAKIEKLAEYLLKDGLVSSLSSYNDYECEYPGFKRFFLLIFFFLHFCKHCNCVERRFLLKIVALIFDTKEKEP